MSIRNIRKLYGTDSLPPPEGNSDEEYEPLYAKGSPSKYKYQGLVLSSHSESGSDHESPSGAVELEDESPAVSTKKKKKKKKKQRKAKHILLLSSKEILELDEIDKSVMEVNALLGTPPPAAPTPAKPPPDPVEELLTCQLKHLCVANEMRKMFGPEEVEGRRRGRQPPLHRLFKRAIIMPTDENSYNPNKTGLSMSIQRRENGYTYFTYDHSKEYQKIHKAFVRYAHYRDESAVLSMEESHENMHVEGMLESADSMFRYEAYSPANAIIEQIVGYMQYVAHPQFNFTDRKVRLEYKYPENRPFHIAVLKYLYLLTNRACHRTALELAKLLLNLDPSDPLAVLFIIDVLALRAREHQWLIDATDHWCKERDAGFLFNIQYSYAMSFFHITTKNKGNVSKADDLLQNAMLRYPTVVLKILQHAGITPSQRLTENALFKSAERATSKKLKDLISLYAKLSWSKWREPAVLEWLNRNALALADKYDVDPKLQERAKKLVNERLQLFQWWPEEVVRHLSIIKPMAGLLLEGDMPRVHNERSWDPVPPVNGISRYGYEILDQARNIAISNSPLYELFSSFLPQYELPPPTEFQRQVLEMRRDAAALAELQERQNNVAVDHGVVAEIQFNPRDEERGAEEPVVEAVPENQARGPSNFVASVGALTNAVRRFMDACETVTDSDDITDEVADDSPD